MIIDINVNENFFEKIRYDIVNRLCFEIGVDTSEVLCENGMERYYTLMVFKKIFNVEEEQIILKYEVMD